MARLGLVRVPYYPQLTVLAQLHPYAPQVMSLLLYWHTRAGTPESYTYCPLRHDFQSANHLGLSREDFHGAFQALEDKGIFASQEFAVPPKEVTAESKVRYEVRYNLNLAQLQATLSALNAPAPAQNLKLLFHAADDSFECYDVICDKFLPVTQNLEGVIAGTDFEAAALLCARFMVYVNEEHEELAQKAIAPGWKLLLNVPLNQEPEDYAKELYQRYVRKGERAVDLSFSDGNFFLPDNDQIKTLVHTVKHYQGKKDQGALTLTAALMLLLCVHFPGNFSYRSELTKKELQAAMQLLDTFEPGSLQHLTCIQQAGPGQLWTQIKAQQK